jgi:glycosyltransferase involved in cell wall biosynthesis
MVSTAWRQRHAYEVAQVDVFSGPAFFWAEAACAALSAAAKPYILTLHGGNLPTFAERRTERVRRLLHSAAAVTTPSQYLLERFAPYRPDLRFLPNGLDLRAYAPRALKVAGPRLVWVRTFHHIYNPALAVRMLQRLVQRFPDAHLTMVGPDKGDGSFQVTKRLVADLGLADHITFAGGVLKTDVPKWLGDADIFLNTTNIDSAPVTVVEAMATGLCVVSTNVGGVPYLVDDGRDALLVPPDDPDAMTNAVMRILDTPALAARLSQHARNKAERYDWPPIIAQWRSLLTETARAA